MLCFIGFIHLLFKIIETTKYIDTVPFIIIGNYFDVLYMKNLEKEKEIQIWIIEKEFSFREKLREVLNVTPGMICDQTFGSAESAVRCISPLNLPDVILADIHLPEANGIELIKELKTAYPQIHFLILTNLDDRPTVFNAICVGASGYLIKNTSFEKIVDSIKMVYRGEAPLSGSIATMLLSVFHTDLDIIEESQLTDRQTEILQMLSQGASKKEIIFELNIASHTVDFHLRKVYKKLQVNSQAGAVGKAIRKGLI